jgi:predicted DNA-binding WGR domain protein
MMIAYLEKVEPKQRMLRFYALRVAPTLFGEWTLVREWGRIGSPGTVRLDWFDSASQAEAAGRKLGRQKERRGYRAIA